MYDVLAEHYHLRFADWNASIARQAESLGDLIQRETGQSAPHILDCACGVGTQSLGLAARGLPVVGSDLSEPALARARREAQARNLSIDFHQADLRDLSAVPGNDFDVLLAADNAVPHLLTNSDLEAAARSMRAKLRPGGLAVITIRDYDRLRQEKPLVEPPSFFEGDGVRRFSHQVWEWTANDQYRLHMYLTLEDAGEWRTLYFVSYYRALLRSELETAFQTAGFHKIHWIEPAESNFYQPIAVAV